MYVCMYDASLSFSLSVCLYVCMSVCMYVCVYNEGPERRRLFACVCNDCRNGGDDARRVRLVVENLSLVVEYR